MRTLIIDKKNSEIRVLVYKLRPFSRRSHFFSRRSHNKVLVTKEVSGQIRYDPENIGNSSFDLAVPCSSFFVGGAEYRKKEGRDFSGYFSESDKREIYETMLSDKVLDVDSYPRITVKSKEITGCLSDLKLKAEISLHGINKEVEIEAELSEGDKSSRVRGEFYLKQTDFNITPVSILWGTIRIQNKITVKFDLSVSPNN